LFGKWKELGHCVGGLRSIVQNDMHIGVQDIKNWKQQYQSLTQEINNLFKETLRHITGSPMQSGDIVPVFGRCLSCEHARKSESGEYAACVFWSALFLRFPYKSSDIFNQKRMIKKNLTRDGFMFECGPDQPFQGKGYLGWPESDTCTEGCMLVGPNNKCQYYEQCQGENDANRRTCS